MKLEIDIPSIIYNDAKENRGYISVGKMEIAWKAIADGKPLEQETVSKEVYDHEYFLRKEFELKIDELQRQLEEQAVKVESVLDKIRTEIGNHCGLAKENHCRYCSYCNNLMGVREILEIIDKYRAESEE